MISDLNLIFWAGFINKKVKANRKQIQKCIRYQAENSPFQPR
jgi:hypothetical protein